MKRMLLRSVVVSVMMLSSAMVMAQGKFCKTYEEFAAGRWTPISSLIKGESKNVELKISDNEFKFKTGDSDADKVLKKEALVVEYDGHLYVNCTHLVSDGFTLDVLHYTQAYRYGGNKLLIVGHHSSNSLFLASLAGDIVGLSASGVVGTAASVASTVTWVGSQHLKGFRCYLLDDGSKTVKSVNDEFMKKVLGDGALLKRYESVDSKDERLSASHIIPILKEKGLVKE